jgi:uncharacterized peroxidase-related enzyme
MAHIPLPEALPGIRGLLVFNPATARPMCDLAEALMRGPNTLSMAEREMIATYVSARNDCYYCRACHESAAAQHLGGDAAAYDLIGQIAHGFEAAPLPDKMKALLAIAGTVQLGGKHVTAEDVARARSHGATDREIHDTLLIAAVFRMFNRYIDGLDTWYPTDPEVYREIGRQSAALGYKGRDWKRPLDAVVCGHAEARS